MPDSTIDSFAKSLVVGASVSGAVVDRNPSKRFLRSRGVLAEAVTHAFNGKPGAFVIPRLKISVLDHVSAVLAIDLLFWDSVVMLADPRESRAYLRGFMKAVSSRGLPIILGRIPRIHGVQVHREELNDAIEREVRAYENARVLELDRLYETVMKDDGVKIDGRHHRVTELIPDGLHPGPVAAEYISRELQAVAKTFDLPKVKTAEP